MKQISNTGIRHVAPLLYKVTSVKWIEPLVVLVRPQSVEGTASDVPANDTGQVDTGPDHQAPGDDGPLDGGVSLDTRVLLPGVVQNRVKTRGRTSLRTCRRPDTPVLRLVPEGEPLDPPEWTPIVFPELERSVSNPGSPLQTHESTDGPRPLPGERWVTVRPRVSLTAHVPDPG